MDARMTISLSAELKKRLENMAWENRTGLSEFVRTTLENALTQDQGNTHKDSSKEVDKQAA